MVGVQVTYETKVLTYTYVRKGGYEKRRPPKRRRTPQNAAARRRTPQDAAGRRRTPQATGKNNNNTMYYNGGTTDVNDTILIGDAKHQQSK